jgi:replicative DNA helicase
MHSIGKLANPVTLRPIFQNDEALQEVGGVAYLAQLTGSGAAVIGAKQFAEQIRELALLRAIIGGMSEVIEAACDTSEEIAVAEIVAKAEGILAEICDEEDGDEHISAGDAAARVVDSLSEERLAGVKSGIEKIDATLGSIQPADLVILAARPAMGKTATAISYSIGAASDRDEHGLLKPQHGVLFISIEMQNDHLAERMLADVCFSDESWRVPFNAITSGNANAAQRQNLARGAWRLKELPLQLVDVAAPTPSKISRLIKRYKRRFEARGHKLELVVVDYLQLVRPDHREKDLYAATTAVSKGLKAAAKSNGVGMIALCQLSREVERRADKRPVMADLRDSGSIEQDADSIFFLLRPEYYLAQAKPEVEEQLAIWQDAMERVRCVIEFIVPKRRRGEAAYARGTFYGAYQAVRS